MAAYLFEGTDGEYYSTISPEVARVKDGWLDISWTTNDVNKLLEYYSDSPHNKLPLFIHAIQHGIENKLEIPTVFNLTETVAHNERFTKEFNQFYENWINQNWSNLYDR